MRARLARPAGSVLAGIALLAMITAILASSVVQSGRTNSGTRLAATQQATAGAAERRAAPAVASAFGYPHRCLNIAISAADPDHASAHVDRSGTCTRYRGYVNASFHRVDGVWRLVLDEGQPFVPNSHLVPGGARSAGQMSGYALGCVSIGVALHDPRFGRPDFDRRLSCVHGGR